MKEKRKKRKARGDPQLDPVINWFISNDACKMLTVPGYVKLSEVAEVKTAINKTAELLASMTIHLMQNTEKGDMRITNGLSRKLDISPCKNLTRQTWIQKIVRALLVEGNAIVIPKITTTDEYIDELIPIDPGTVSAVDGEPYGIKIKNKVYHPDDVLHFLINPRSDKYNWGEGYTVELSDIAHNLKQASLTRKDFMASKVLPSLIVKVDANTAALASEDGRNNVYKKYLETSVRGEPWIIPAEMLDVQQVKPLTLNDIAINESIQIDKRTVAAVFGMPAFLLGVGEFKADEYNNFIRTKIMSLAQIIQQELSQKLLWSPDHYFRFNPWSLYAYSINDMANIGSQLRGQGIVSGNEVRDWIGLSPREGLDELVMLENYIPADRLGDQEKIGGKKTDG